MLKVSIKDLASVILNLALRHYTIHLLEINYTCFFYKKLVYKKLEAGAP